MLTRDIRAILICALVAVAVIAAVFPTVEMGVNDDWLYVGLAERVAQTGGLKYDGWIIPMVGFQAYWAALFFKLLGTSFGAARISVVPLAAGCAVLLYLIARSLNARIQPALLGSLTLAVSPLFLPLAASFMTDIPGLFFFLLTLYCAYRSARAPDGGFAVAWLTAALVAGFLAGTIRQAFWGAPLSMIPLVCFLRRRDRRMVILGALFWLVLAAGIWSCLIWHHNQPQAVPEPTFLNLPSAWSFLRAGARLLIGLVLTLTLLALPCLAGLVPAALQSRHARWAAFAVFLGLCGIAVYRPDIMIGPWMGNIITQYAGLPPNADIIGDKPVVLGRGLWVVLSGLTFATLAALTACVMKGLWRKAGAKPLRSSQGVTVYCLLAAPICVGYVLLLVPRFLHNMVYDRYVLVLLAAALPVIVTLYPARLRSTAGVLLAVFGCYAIASTHDAYAVNRARWRAGNAVLASGISRQCVTGGYEFDGWTQLRATGYLRNRHANSPLQQDWDMPGEQERENIFWFLVRTPSVRPRFVIALSRQPGLAESGLPAFRYTTWLPPRQRAVWVQLNPNVACDVKAAD